MNAMRAPLGDQAGDSSAAPLLVTFVGPLPSGATVQTSPPRTNAIRRSGPTEGSVSAAGSVVSRVTEPPPDVIEYSSKLPSRSVEKTIVPFAPGIAVASGSSVASTAAPTPIAARAARRRAADVVNDSPRSIPLPVPMVGGL